MSPFKYLDHTADMCVQGIGTSVEEAFCEAARAVSNLMVDLDLVVPKTRIQVSVGAPSLEFLLVEWLGALISQKDLSRMIFCRFGVDIVTNSKGFRLEGEGWGEELNHVWHRAKLEVKGVSYAGLQVSRGKEGWIAQCVVDV